MYCYMTTPEGIEELSALHNLIDIQCDPETLMPRTFSYRPRWADPAELPVAEFAFSHYGFTPNNMMAMFFAPTARTTAVYTELGRTQVLLLPALMPEAPVAIQ